MKMLLLHDKVTVASGRTLIGSGFNILSGQGTAEHCLDDIILYTYVSVAINIIMFYCYTIN